MTREKYELAIGRIDAADFNATTKTFEIVALYVDSLEQRIEELEAPKSCATCKHSLKSDDGYDFYCPIQQDYFNEGICCDYYKPKEQK